MAHMTESTGKTAVVTGAGSGIGRELALLCAARGMGVVLADVDAPGLEDTAALLPAGAPHLCVDCDVSKVEAVERLASLSEECFGAVHLLFNNAGVAVSGPTWTTTLEEWKWVLEVNLMGVVHGVRSFVPRMLAHGHKAHVVNTASAAGLLSPPGTSVYCASKHAVVALSECLEQELRAAKSTIGVSVLCPGFVKTGIADAARNRPAELESSNPLGAAYAERARQAIEAARLSAADVARITLDGVDKGLFYILPHPGIKDGIASRMGDMLSGRMTQRQIF